MINLYRGLGTIGVVIAALVAFTMCLLSLIFHPVDIKPIEYGICLPSPDAWDFPAVGAWVINTFLIGFIAALLYVINKTYNFIRTTEPALVMIFLVTAASGPWFTQTINTSVLLCLANVVCLGIIFDSYDTRNATQEMFIMGAVVGMGAMVQYAFLPLGIVFFLWALFMKVLRIKETLAFIAGILCPYWIALGVGWLSFSDFHFPSLTPLFSYADDPSEFFILLACIGVSVATGFLCTLVNAMKLYAGNSKIYAMNLCVMASGGIAAICIMVDFDNMHAYVTTLYMATAVQLANICALWRPRMPWTVTVVPALAYIGAFVCSLIF